MSQPIERLASLGHIHCSIFQNQGEKGSFLTATIQRRYKKKKDEWQASDSYTLQDLLQLRQVVDETIDRVRQLQRQEEAEKEPQAEQVKQVA